MPTRQGRNNKSHQVVSFLEGRAGVLARDIGHQTGPKRKRKTQNKNPIKDAGIVQKDISKVVVRGTRPRMDVWKVDETSFVACSCIE
jgi:hypothetical protein